MAKTQRTRKEEILKDWINRITTSPGAMCAFDRAEERGLRPVETFESARVKDVQLMITLCVAAYNHGCDSTRKHISELRRKEIAVTVCTPEQYRDIQGIHLIGPDLWYLNDALNTAERDGFRTIFLHYDRQGTAGYRIAYDVANRLAELSRQGYRVSFTHPCANGEKESA